MARASSLPPSVPILLPRRHSSKTVPLREKDSSSPHPAPKLLLRKITRLREVFWRSPSATASPPCCEMRLVPRSRLVRVWLVTSTLARTLLPSAWIMLPLTSRSSTEELVRRELIRTCPPSRSIILPRRWSFLIAHEGSRRRSATALAPLFPIRLPARERCVRAGCPPRAWQRVRPPSGPRWLSSRRSAASTPFFESGSESLSSPLTPSQLRRRSRCVRLGISFITRAKRFTGLLSSAIHMPEKSTSTASLATRSFLAIHHLSSSSTRFNSNTLSVRELWRFIRCRSRAPESGVEARELPAEPPRVLGEVVGFLVITFFCASRMMSSGAMTSSSSPIPPMSRPPGALFRSSCLRRAST
mmetsp:Transcript_29630/g.95133  ORF Transcript_29630/g.95133 Transcript_29630/m.95133 type:complete len:358 (+) Transcript_29630:5820-6893(+)